MDLFERLVAPVSDTALGVSVAQKYTGYLSLVERLGVTVSGTAVAWFCGLLFSSMLDRVFAAISEIALL